MKKFNTSLQSISIAAIAIFLCALPFSLKAYVASDFNWRPPFTMSNEMPSVTILLDSSDAMHRMAFAHVEEPNSNIADVYEEYGYSYKPNLNYMGYFKNTKYRYVPGTDGYFVEDPNGSFSGNFMNWATMHRLDIARIILTGGYWNNSTNNFEVIKTNYIKTSSGVKGNVRPIYSEYMYNATITPAGLYSIRKHSKYTSTTKTRTPIIMQKALPDLLTFISETPIPTSLACLTTLPTRRDLPWPDTTS